MPNNGLRFVKIDDIHLIPRQLLEQVKGVEWAVDDLIKLWPVYAGSPLNLLYALADADHQVQGVVWCSINPLRKVIFVNLVSLTKDYQNTGFFKNQIIPFIREIQQKLQLHSTLWLTTRPQAFKRLGFQETRQILMEGN
jgi:hypothetical protein